MKLKSFLKDNLIYIILCISAMFLSYLTIINHDLSIVANILIIIFYFFGCLALGMVSKKKLKEIVIARKYKILSLGIGLLCGILFVFWNFNLIYYDVRSSSITLNEDNGIADNIVETVTINNINYKIKNNQFFNTLKEDEIVDAKIIVNDNIIVLEFGKYNNIKINFKQNIEKVNIIDGNVEKTLKFDKESRNENFQYILRSNYETSSIVFLRIIVFFIVCTNICFLISLIILLENNQDKKFFMITSLVVLGIGVFYFNYIKNGILTPDSNDYITYIFRDLLNLKFSSGRTPVYPFIIRVIYLIFGKEYIYFLCLFQYCIWFVSILYLYKILALFIKNNYVIQIFTVIYALCPGIVNWNSIVLTESIALSMTIIFIFYIIKYLKDNSLFAGMAAIIIAFILTFHRPTAIIYVVFLEGFWLLRFIFDRKNIKMDLKCFVLSTITIGFIIGYSIIFHRTFGIYSISDAVVRQDLYVSINNEYYKSSDNKLFVTDVEEALVNNPDNKWGAMLEVLGKYKNAEIKKITKETRKKNFDKYLVYLNDLVIEQAGVKFEAYNYEVNNFVNNNLVVSAMRSSFTFITFAHVYIFTFIELIVSLYKGIKYKMFPWINLGLALFPLIIIVSSFVGTCGEFMRTAICAVPFTYLSLVLLINEVFNIKRKDDSI